MTRRSPLSTARAFTLIEIMIVLGIITLIAALGVPVYNALSGSRSVEAAQNQVSAYLGQARTIAINEGKSAGVMFYVDPATERTAMAIVIVGDTTLEDPDPYDKYMGWIPTANYTEGNLDPNGDGNTSDRTRAERIIGMVSDGDIGFDGSSYPTSTGPAFSTYVDARRYIGNYRPAVRNWRAKQDNTGSPAVRVGSKSNAFFAETIGNPSSPGANSYTRTPLATVGNRYENNNWSLNDTAKVITQYAQSEQQLLPKGIGLQVVIQPTQRSDSVVYADRYVRTGVILFDAQGRLVLRDLQLPKSTTLGEYLELAADAQGIVSGVGVALYNDAAFRNFTNNGEQTSQGDWLYGGNASNTYYLNSPSPAIADAPAAFTSEKAEEDWLANNTVPVLINRFSGSLSETE